MNDNKSEKLQQRADKAARFKDGVDYHWILIEHLNGDKEQILVADEPGEDCNVHDRVDEIKGDPELIETIKSIQIQAVNADLEL